MQTTTHHHRITAADCHLPDLLAILAEPTVVEDHPLADRVDRGVLVYEAAAVRAALAAGSAEQVEGEMVRALTDGPGIVVLAGAFDAEVVDRVSAAYERIVAEEKAGGGTRGRSDTGRVGR